MAPEIKSFFFFFSPVVSVQLRGPGQQDSDWLRQTRHDKLIRHLSFELQHAGPGPGWKRAGLGENQFSCCTETSFLPWILQETPESFMEEMLQLKQDSNRSKKVF